MTKQHTRREIVKGSLALAGLGVLGLPEWALPALAQGESVVPFTDIPRTSASVGRSQRSESSTSGRSTGPTHHGTAACVRLERGAAEPRAGRSAATRRARVVWRVECEVADRTSMPRRTGCSASGRRAGIARCGPRRSVGRRCGTKPRSLVSVSSRSSHASLVPGTGTRCWVSSCTMGHRCGRWRSVWMTDPGRRRRSTRPPPVPTCCRLPRSRFRHRLSDTPDLRRTPRHLGVWSNDTITPPERPARLADQALSV